jgi:hypothetical protein
MSRSLAVKIARTLNLNHTPSAFQGRIGSAKGLWIIECNSNPDDEEVWIKITDSQAKFESTRKRELEDCWRTFEVLDYSTRLSSGSFNKQFLTILSENGVPRSVLAEKVRIDLLGKIDGMKTAMEDPVAFRKWCHDRSKKRSRSDGMKWEAGLPSCEGDLSIGKISFLLDVRLLSRFIG